MWYLTTKNAIEHTGTKIESMISPAWVWVLGWLLSIFAFAGNSVVIVLIAGIQRLHCPTNWLLFSLSWADLGVSLTLFPANLLCELEKGCYYVPMAILQYSFLFASVTNLCMLTVDRYVAIIKPFAYVLFQSKRRTIGMACIAWVVPFVFCVIPLTFIYTRHDQIAMFIFTFAAVILFEFLPSLILLFPTIHMVIIARKHARETAAMIVQLQYNQAGRETSPSRGRTVRGRSSVKFIVSIVAFFGLCYSVTIGVTCCQIFQICEAPYEVEQLRMILLAANSGFNPLAYAFLKQDIKKEVKRLLHITDTPAYQRDQLHVEMEQR